MAAREFFDTLESRIEPGRISGLDHSYLFDIEGEGRWLVDIRGGTLKVTEDPAGEADATITASGAVFDRITAGEQNAMTAYMTGKLKISGDLGAAMKLQKIF